MKHLLYFSQLVKGIDIWESIEGDDTILKVAIQPARGGVSLQRKVTMTDVARAAGCSQATVSLVLNNAPGVKISPDMRSRVIEAARTLGYVAPIFVHMEPATPEQALSDGPIGFLVDQMATSPEAVVAIEGVRQACWDESRVVLAAQSMNDAEMERKTVATLLAQGARALIYMTIFTRKITLPPCLVDATVPVVLLNCYSGDARLPSVVPAEVEGGQRATQHLIDNNHRRIAMITGEPWMEAARDRLKGYRRAILAANIPFDPAIVMQGNWSPSAGYECTRRLLQLKDRPTAIFCQNDRMAIGCYEALKEAGLHIPDDMSVVGYDDEEISRHLYPQLTTVVLPHRMMGHWAVEKIEHYWQNQKSVMETVRMDCALTERASVGFLP